MGDEKTKLQRIVALSKSQFEATFIDLLRAKKITVEQFQRTSEVWERYHPNQYVEISIDAIELFFTGDGETKTTDAKQGVLGDSSGSDALRGINSQDGG